MLVNVALTIATQFPTGTVERTPNAVVIHWRDQRIALTPLTDASVNVTATTPNGSPQPSFVRLPVARVPKFTVQEDRSAVRVKVRRLTVVFDRKTGALAFRDGQGKSLLSELPGTRVMAPVTLQGTASLRVGQGFDAPSGERLYGLGQFQDGIWNWRGLPVELRQLNTQIAVPMLVSSRGFGLLWENASRTDFNPTDTEVSLARTTTAATDGPTATEQLSGRGRRSNAPVAVTGDYVAPHDGTYAFCVRNGDRRNLLSLQVKGQTLAEVRNLWTPSALTGTVQLRAGERVPVRVEGGGGGTRVYVRRIDETTTFRSDFGDRLDYTVFAGPKASDIVAEYRKVTGPAVMWPRWAYGFWQCRERYSSQDQILNTVAEYRKRQIPIDLLVQDWQYWGNHGWGSYEWDERAYPDPASMIAQLHAQDVRFMISVWCNPSGIAKEALAKQNALVGNWVDVFSPTGRDTRWDYIDRAFFSKGTDAWWGDATEPGDPGTEILGLKTGLGPADAVTSAYPLFASQGLYEGQRRANPNKRVCILTRSAFPGIQRYGAASWSGDVMGDWETFRRQIPAGLNFSLAGVPYWTTDAGGFFRPNGQYESKDYNELLARWFQWSAFCPIFRMHGYQTSTEIWNYLPETQRVFQKFDELRYRLLPYHYALAWDVAANGQSFMRPLATEFPDDATAAGVADAYLYGPGLLVAPVTSPGGTRRVYLPATKGGWYGFWSREAVSGGQIYAVQAPLDEIPLYVRAGTILPMDPVRQHANQRVTDPTELRVYRGADGTFTLYDDAGDGYGYEKGERSLTPLAWSDRTGTLTFGKRVGTYPGMETGKAFRIHVIGAGETELWSPTLIYRGDRLTWRAR